MIIHKSYPTAPYSCYDDFVQLGKFKESIDFHRLNLGNPSKSIITANQLKQMENDYEGQKKLYDSSECMNNPEKNKCYSLRRDIERLEYSNNKEMIFDDPINLKEIKSRLEKMKEDYKNLNCEAIINTSRKEYVSSAINVFNQLDKQRIEADSIYERNKRVIFGGVILILGIALIMDFKKSKK